MTEELVGKLETMFKLGVKDTIACTYAKIHQDTFYEWLKSDEEFSDRIAAGCEEEY